MKLTPAGIWSLYRQYTCRTIDPLDQKVCTVTTLPSSSLIYTTPLHLSGESVDSPCLQDVAAIPSPFGDTPVEELGFSPVSGFSPTQGRGRLPLLCWPNNSLAREQSRALSCTFGSTWGCPVKLFNLIECCWFDELGVLYLIDSVLLIWLSQWDYSI